MVPSELPAWEHGLIVLVVSLSLALVLVGLGVAALAPLLSQPALPLRTARVVKYL